MALILYDCLAVSGSVVFVVNSSVPYMGDFSACGGEQHFSSFVSNCHIWGWSGLFGLLYCDFVFFARVFLFRSFFQLISLLVNNCISMELRVLKPLRF